LPTKSTPWPSSLMLLKLTTYSVMILFSHRSKRSRISTRRSTLRSLQSVIAAAWVKWDPPEVRETKERTEIKESRVLLASKETRETKVKLERTEIRVAKAPKERKVVKALLAAEVRRVTRELKAIQESMVSKERRVLRETLAPSVFPEKGVRPVIKEVMDSLVTLDSQAKLVSKDHREMLASKAQTAPSVSPVPRERTALMARMEETDLSVTPASQAPTANPAVMARRAKMAAKASLEHKDPRVIRVRSALQDPPVLQP